MSGPLFFFGAMSPYSRFAAERIDALIDDLEWRPVFAGGLFRSVGRESWGLTERRQGGIAECEARALRHGLGRMRWPEGWPASTGPSCSTTQQANRSSGSCAFAPTMRSRVG
jgi:2-hydroxychromene-2-carboxylate isomerase